MAGPVWPGPSLRRRGARGGEAARRPPTKGGEALTIRGLGHGQIWWADLDKVRPVMVLTRRRVAPLLHRVLVAPVTSTVRGLSVEVAVGEREGVKEGSVVNLDNAQLVPVDRLLRRAGAVTDERWPEVCLAMTAVLGC